ncbi:cyclic nucleotide-binding/CBS domain-containing protein [Cellulomonas sp. APG4]|uniref:DUF294 nucleotidyltransferase-like domain-containing protein n=1 Tax=Cellulomonas sp. APG4 TaxID=1538656 RepID=UPI00137ACDF5|nr:DUF294 nucleotidyltransferase-like domain-containing protein [Cellulomonas sp. APG4]NCT90176.1 cyclic nucleotide-binding/CBS domain-containing protein [Cellulomonas sp. APG4]
MDAELAEVRDFLAQHAPFDVLRAEVLDRLPARLGVRYFRRGTMVLALDEVTDVVRVLRSGAVEARDGSGELVDRIEAGGLFGMSTLLEGTGSAYAFTAIEDSLVLEVPQPVVVELCGVEPRVADHLEREHRRRLGRAVTVQVGDRSEAGLRTRARDLVRRPPQTAPSTVTIREAATRMRDAGVSSLLLMAGDQLAGIVTDRDLRNRVLAPGLDPDHPVSTVMSDQPVTGSADALAFELLMEMVARNIHHLPLVEQGRVVGVVTSTDLMRLEHADPVYLVGDVRKARTVEEVVAAARRIPETVQRLVTSGTSDEDVGRVTTAVGDAVERRLIDLALAELGPAPVPWCWVVLGSRARGEQALGGDQDHALLLGDEAGPEHDAWFATLAERVTAGLEACGWPRCRGDVMATNPRWRQAVAAWQQTFGRWLDAPEPMAVMQGTIFFDMRPLHGDAGLFDRLQAWVLHRSPHQQIFLGYLAQNAVGTPPPLGFFRGFVLEREGEHVATLDLKHRGLGAIVAVARAHALAAGVPEVGTRARLRAVVAAGRLSADDADDLAGAMDVIGHVRLEHQARQVRSDREPDNYVAPDELSSFDQRNLRDAFGIVKHAQAGLARRHLLRYMS